MDTNDPTDRAPPPAPRVDAYLSRKAHAVFPGALVYERADGSWSLERPAAELTLLGGSFKEARQALWVILAAERQRMALSDEGS